MSSVGSAPGRLDLLGGVADYSGALVLEIPTQVTTRVTVEPDDDLVVGPLRLSTEAVRELAALPYPSVRDALEPQPTWTRYPIGVAIVLTRHGVIDAPAGTLTIDSDVPVAVGVSSSAALEVATARALGADIEPLRLAALCQEAENQVVGAPCGIMDQVTVTLGRPGEVLPILCRPASVDRAVPLPTDVEVVGWPTGATHDVGGSPYARARAAAFMGKRIAESSAGRRWTWVSEIEPGLLDDLPETIDGATYLDRWGSVDDPLTTIDPSDAYPVRAATAFGVEEHARTTAAAGHLLRGEPTRLGPLMAASHAGYDAMGLGHPLATAVVQEALDHPGVHGARSSGGGCGGTVVVLCDRGALDHIDELIR